MRLLITGATGNLGRHLVRIARQRGFLVIAWGSPRGGEVDGQPVIPVDLTNQADTADAFWRARPMAVIHSAAMSSIQDCHRDPVAAFRMNVEATRQMVGLCVAGVSRLVYTSTDLVFDGLRGNYSEDDQPQPLSLYGKSKLAGEKAVLIHPGHLVVRLSWLLGTGPKHRRNFFDRQVSALRQGEPITLFVDEWRSPLGLSAAAEGLVELACSDRGGILHLGGPERLCRYQMGLELAKMLGIDAHLIQRAHQAEQPAPEPRPLDVSLNSSRWRSLYPHCPWPTYETSLREALLGAD